MHDSPLASLPLEQDGFIFRSLFTDSDHTVTPAGLRYALERVAGLRLATDERLASLRAALLSYGDTTPLTFDQFAPILRQGGRLMLRALQGELCVPDFQTFRDTVEGIYDEIATVDPIDGPLTPPVDPPKLAVFHDAYNVARNADYIPALSNVRDAWGVSICTVDGQIISLGAHSTPFSIQSCCKPVNYAHALETFNRTENDAYGLEGGTETPEAKATRRSLREAARKHDKLSEIDESHLGVHDFIDCEPSGQPFNEFSFNRRAIPYNSMINAGAITCSALVSGAREVHVSTPEIQEVWRRLAAMDHIPPYDGGTAGGERSTGLNNIAIAYKLGSYEALPAYVDSAEKLNRVLDYYFQCCSLTLTSDQMAISAATLANRGVCPLTGDRVFHAQTVTNCLAAMLHCGMYDSSGKFGRLVGLPAKSGVGGGIMVVVPGVMGICTFAPRLDSIGNSLRGLRFFERLLDSYALHMLELPSLMGGRKTDIRVSQQKARHYANQGIVGAASLGDVDAIVQFEYDAGSPGTYLALLQAADYDGRTPLHLAAVEGRTEVVEYLLQRAIYLQPLDRWKQTPLSDARSAGHDGIARMIEDALRVRGESTIEPQPGITDERRSERDTVRAKLRGFAPNTASTTDQLEPIWAAAEGDIETLRRHVARGYDLHIRDYDDRTPLHLATAEGRPEVVSFLVNFHVQSVESDGGDEVLHAQARLSWPDRWGRTPLDEARDPRVLADEPERETAIRAALAACAVALEKAGASTSRATAP